LDVFLITGSGYLKDEQFEEDRDKLVEFYRDHGYIDFESKISNSQTRPQLRW